MRRWSHAPRVLVQAFAYSNYRGRDHRRAHLSEHGAYRPPYIGQVLLRRLRRPASSSTRDLGADGRLTVEPFATNWYGTSISSSARRRRLLRNWGDGSTGSGSVVRIVYTPGNRSPVARAEARRPRAPVPLDGALHRPGSSDPDGDALTYDWDFGDGDGSTARRPTRRTPTTSGDYEARADRPRRQGGRGHGDGCGYRPATRRPSAVDRSPGRRLEVPDRPDIASRGGHGRPGGDLGGARLRWHIVLVHNTHTHGGEDLTGTQPGVIAASDHDADAHYRITLTATDSGGLSASKTIDLYPAVRGSSWPAHRPAPRDLRRLDGGRADDAHVGGRLPGEHRSGAVLRCRRAPLGVELVVGRRSAFASRDHPGGGLRAGRRPTATPARRRSARGSRSWSQTARRRGSGRCACAGRRRARRT